MLNYEEEPKYEHLLALLEDVLLQSTNDIRRVNFIKSKQTKEVDRVKGRRISDEPKS